MTGSKAIMPVRGVGKARVKGQATSRMQRNDVRHVGQMITRIDPPGQVQVRRAAQSDHKRARAVIAQGQRTTHHDHTSLNRKIDGSAHHREQTKIERTGSQRGKVNKKRDNRNRCNQKERNNRDYHRVKGRERKNTWEVRHRQSNQHRSCDRQSGMARLKKMHRKRNPPGKEVPNSLRRLTRMAQAAKDAEGTFQTRVAPKGKETITRWEKELKNKCKGKARDALVQEADWVTDLGATQPRETLFHKTVEMAWLTKMMIGKVISEREEARQEDNKENKKMLDEILRRINSLETITKLLVEVEKDQKCKLERLAAQFHLYLRYVHHMDITPADGHGAPTQIRKTRTTSQKEDNKSQADGGKEHPQVQKHFIVLDQ
jgi:hypothetical protein